MKKGVLYYHKQYNTPFLLTHASDKIHAQDKGQ